MKAINVYTIEEIKNIDEEVYNKIIEREHTNILNDNHEFEVHAEMILENFILEVSRIGFEVSKDDIRYDISYRQGSGSSFTGNINILDFLESSSISDKNKKRIKALINNNHIENYVSIENCGFHNYYCHEKTATASEIEIYTDFIKTEKLALILSELEEELEDIRLDKCYELHTKLERAYESIQTEEYIYIYIQC